MCFLWWREKGGLWKGGDTVFDFRAEFAFFFRVAAGFVADKGGVTFRSNALKYVVDFVVHEI